MLVGNIFSSNRNLGSKTQKLQFCGTSVVERLERLRSQRGGKPFLADNRTQTPLLSAVIEAVSPTMPPVSLVSQPAVSQPAVSQPTVSQPMVSQPTDRSDQTQECQDGRPKYCNWRIRTPSLTRCVMLKFRFWMNLREWMNMMWFYTDIFKDLQFTYVRTQTHQCVFVKYMYHTKTV